MAIVSQITAIFPSNMQFSSFFSSNRPTRNLRRKTHSSITKFFNLSLTFFPPKRREKKKKSQGIHNARNLSWRHLLFFGIFFSCGMLNRIFPSSKNSHFKNEAKCKTFLVKMSFIYVIIKKHFHINGFALCLSLKQRLGATRKWSIVMTLPSFISRGAGYESVYYGINNTRPFRAEKRNEHA